MPYNNVMQKAMEVAHAYLLSQNVTDVTAANTFKGLDSEALETIPRVVVSCTSAEAEQSAPFVGNWNASMEVIVRTNADDTSDDEHHLLSGRVFDVFMDDTIKTGLTSSSSDFTCFGVVPVDQTWNIDQRSHVSRLRLTLHCAGSYIS